MNPFGYDIIRRVKWGQKINRNNTDNDCVRNISIGLVLYHKSINELCICNQETPGLEPVKLCKYVDGNIL